MVKMDAECSMTTSLMRWLAFYASDAQEECVSIVLRVLKLAFPHASDEQAAVGGWRAVLAVLERFYDSNLAVNIKRLERSNAELNDTLRAVLELVLGAVVRCETKETFVKDILTMEDGVQADLMAIIEKVMAQGPAILKVEADDEKKQEKEAPGLGSPLYLSRNAALESLQRENKVLKEESIYLATELERTVKTLQTVEGEKEKLAEVVQELKDHVDTDAMRMERAMHAQYDERIRNLQLELDLAKTELSDKASLAQKVSTLSDEVDLLRPLADKMKKVGTTMAKYQAKIDALSGAKDTLKRLEGTNAELVERNLKLESELAKAAALQRKLNEAKEANTAVEFRVSELETLLGRERVKLATTCSELVVVQSALHESKTLNTQLQESFHHQSTSDASVSSAAMASGISEFNPELMQKLSRLEFENGELKKQVDSDTKARIDKLLDEINDLTRLKKSFEKKYFDTQQDLQSTQSELKQTAQHFESAVAELHTKSREFNERKECLEEDVVAHALELRTVIAARDHLAAELADSKKRENGLNRDVLDLYQDLSASKEARHLLEFQNEQLELKCECLSNVRDDLGSKLARQIEYTAMQAEDAIAERLRFAHQEEDKQAQTCLKYEECIALNAAEIDQVTTTLQQAERRHFEDRRRLEASNLSTTKELEQYRNKYSVSNADWSKQEKELHKRITVLESMHTQSDQHEQELKATIKSQLHSNARLVEKNRALKADAVEKREVIAKLELAKTRLESRAALLEKERNYFSAQEERKRDVEDAVAAYSSQLSTQVTALASELSKVSKDNVDLRSKQVGCRCSVASPPRGAEAKSYYLTQIQQLDQDKHLANQKRRELLLVNAKLIHEQKQLHLKNLTLSSRVCDLEESVNHWRLRDERRMKQEGHPILDLDNEVFACTTLERDLESTTNHDTGDELPTQQDIRENEPQMVRVGKRDGSLSAVSSVEDMTILERSTATSVRRKRKLESENGTPESVHPTSAKPVAYSDFTEAEAFFSQRPPPSSKSASEPRSKRRLSHFITHNHKNNKQPDKPSECTQQ
ncbi:Protein Hook 3 [Phytophthora citrophthora]|uniref:Protein Hook 3 n=1 Tax=Phytophthora citrophthora TaxID=4793 RepID=A0AAD9LQ32_9STRA|nr:Protein Hook 3 [Phytophthora citrophthora]